MAANTLNEQSVLLTGATGGLGVYLARAFARRKADRLVLCDHASRSDELALLATELQSEFGAVCYTITGDLSAPSGPRDLYNRAKAALRNAPPDLLVNNAGLLSYGRFWEIDPERLRHQVLVNDLAPLLLSRFYLADALAAGRGRILNIVSGSAYQPTPYLATYGASKAFLLQLSAAINAELGAVRSARSSAGGVSADVRIYSAYPPFTETTMIDSVPASILWFRINPRAKAERMAERCVRAYVNGKQEYIPGFLNILTHALAPRLSPLAVQKWFGETMLRNRAKGR